jgi:hypothetical protein
MQSARRSLFGSIIELEVNNRFIGPVGYRTAATLALTCTYVKHTIRHETRKAFDLTGT